MAEKLLTIVMPAYNEEASLPSFLPSVIDYCKSRNWNLIVVNDGSTDRTAQILGEYARTESVSILTHKVNRGYGGALKTGIQAAQTPYVATIDADGQHYLDDVTLLLEEITVRDADMVVGSRSGQKVTNAYRNLGKRLIRWVANLMLKVHVQDLNSGMKLFVTDLAKRCLKLCPDSMAFSEVFTLVFISRRHLVLEHPIRIRERIAGESTINTRTAFETVMEILNLVVLFNPMRIFLPLAIFSLIIGFAWGLPIVLRGDGVSVGAMLAIVTGVIFFFLALLAEQISLIRQDLEQ